MTARSTTTDTRSTYYAALMAPHMIQLRNEIRDTMTELCLATDSTARLEDNTNQHVGLAGRLTVLQDNYAHLLRGIFSHVEYPESKLFTPRAGHEIVVW